MANVDNNILIIGEFPVIHKGYIDFFEKVKQKYCKANIYLGFLSDKAVREMTELEPDIRKIPYSQIKEIIKAILPIKKFLILDKEDYSKSIKEFSFQKIIILKGEKSENFAKIYLTDKRYEKYKKNIEYFDIRLKWQDGKVAEFKKINSRLSEKELKIHQRFMKEAFEEAENSKCWWRQVGAVLVKNKKIILRAFNEMMPSDDECYKIGCIRDGISPGKTPEICSVAHAEVSLIAAAAKKGLSLENTTMYLTHFPCSACSKLVALSGIQKLVYSRGSSVFDGERVLKSKGVEIIKI